MMHNFPLVSVVIPTYNHAHFLKEALDSVCAQTYENWDAVIINNYSDDNTIQVVDSFADSRIRLINFHNYGIIAASRNEGIRNAMGEYVAFLDSDDLWYPEKIARCVEILNKGYDLVCHGEYWTKKNTEKKRPIFYGPQSRYPKLLYQGNCISTSATVVRKTILDQLHGFLEGTEFITAEDYELWLRISRETDKFWFIPEILGEYRIHGGNASKAVIRNMKAELAVVQHHFNMVTDVSLWMSIKQCKRKAIAYYRCGRGLEAERNYSKALHYFWKSFIRWPLNMRLYITIMLTILSWCYEAIKLRNYE